MNKNVFHDSVFEKMQNYADDKLIKSNESLIVYLTTGKVITANQLLYFSEDDETISFGVVKQSISRRNNDVVLEHHNEEKGYVIRKEHIVYYEMIGDVYTKAEVD